MKKFFLAVMAMGCVVCGANAQTKGDMSAGLNLNYRMWNDGSDFNNLGIGAKFRYNVTDPIRLEANFNYTFAKEDVTAMDYTINGHYLFTVADKFVLYPTVGLGFTNLKFEVGDFSKSSNEFMWQLGAGAEYPITDVIGVNVEFKYNSVGGDIDDTYFMLNAGVTYKF